MAYRHNTTLYKNQKKAHRFRKFAIFAGACFAIATIFIAGDWLLSQLSGANTVVSKTNNTSVQSANVSVYRTKYFQFQAPQEWVSVENESTDKKFVYLKKTEAQFLQKLVIYVDRPTTDREADFKLTRVLPVQISELGNLIQQSNVSDHCNNSFPKDGYRDPRRITHNEVSFVCDPDSQQYSILVGEIGGSEELEVNTSDGSKIKLVIVFSDLTAYPNTGDLYNIVSSLNIL